MRSFQIYTQFTNDTHGNANNATRDRLKKILEDRSVSNHSESLSQPMAPLNATTLTAADGGVYQAYSDKMSELTLLQTYLEKINVTAGGECNDPITTLFNQSNCIDYNNTNPQLWDTKLILAACNTNTSLNISSNSMLSLVTAFCAVRADAADTPDDEYKHVLNIILLIIGLTILGAIPYACCSLLNPRNNRSWLEDRRREHIDRAQTMYMHVNRDGNEIPYSLPGESGNDALSDEEAGLYDPLSPDAFRAAPSFTTRLT